MGRSGRAIGQSGPDPDNPGEELPGTDMTRLSDSVETALKYVEAFEFLFKCELMKRGVRSP